MCLETREGCATLHKHHKYTQHVSSYTHIPCFLASFSTRCLVEVCLVRFQPRWHQTQHIRWINSRRNQLLKGRWATRIFNDPAVHLPNDKTRHSIITSCKQTVTIVTIANYDQTEINPHHCPPQPPQKIPDATLPLIFSHHLPLPNRGGTSSALRRSCSCSSAALRASSASRFAKASSTKRCSRSASSASFGFNSRQVGSNKMVGFIQF